MDAVTEAALIRLVLKTETRTNDGDHEWIDINTIQDRVILQAALAGLEEEING